MSRAAGAARRSGPSSSRRIFGDSDRPSFPTVANAFGGIAIAFLVGTIAFAPLEALGIALACIVAAAIVACPIIGLGLIALSVPFGSVIAIPLGPGALTSTPLLLAWTALVVCGRALAGLDWGRPIWRRPGALPASLDRDRPAGRRQGARLDGVLWAGLFAYSIALCVSAWRAPSLEASILEAARWAEFGVAVALASAITGGLRNRRVGLLVARGRWLAASLLLAGASQAAVALWMASTGVGPEAFAVLGGRLFRAHGTFGQPNPFGGYMNLIWPLGAALVIERVLPWHGGRASASPTSNPEELDRSGPRLEADATARLRKPAPSSTSGFDSRIIAARTRPTATSTSGSFSWSIAGLGLITAGLCLVGLALSWSRGAWLAGAAAGAAMACLWIEGLLRRPTPTSLRRSETSGVAGSRSRRTRIPATAALYLVLVAALAAAILDAPIPIPSGVSDRLGSIAEGAAALDVAEAEVNDANFATIERLAHWEAARSMWAQRPWFGQGPGHYELAYTDHRLPRWSEPLGHAHNYYLHALAETGLAGLAGYLALIAAIVAVTLRSALFAGSSFERALGLGLAGAIASASVHGLFDNVWVHEMPTHVGLLVGLTLGIRARG